MMTNDVVLFNNAVCIFTVLYENIAEEGFFHSAVFLWDILLPSSHYHQVALTNVMAVLAWRPALSESISEPINNCIPPSVRVR